MFLLPLGAELPIINGNFSWWGMFTTSENDVVISKNRHDRFDGKASSRAEKSKPYTSPEVVKVNPSGPSQQNLKGLVAPENKDKFNYIS